VRWNALERTRERGHEFFDGRGHELFTLVTFDVCAKRPPLFTQKGYPG